jgi:hypothetical protein
MCVNLALLGLGEAGSEQALQDELVHLAVRLPVLQSVSSTATRFMGGRTHRIAVAVMQRDDVLLQIQAVHTLVVVVLHQLCAVRYVVRGPDAHRIGQLRALQRVVEGAHNVLGEVARAGLNADLLVVVGKELVGLNLIEVLCSAR